MTLLLKVFYNIRFGLWNSELNTIARQFMQIIFEEDEGLNKFVPITGHSEHHYFTVAWCACVLGIKAISERNTLLTSFDVEKNSRTSGSSMTAPSSKVK